MTIDDRNRVDSASGGALVDKKPADAKKLIANMAANSQYRGRSTKITSSHQVKEVGSSNIEQKVANLTSLMEQVITGKGQVMVCGVCSILGHSTDTCPTLQDEQDL